MITSRLVVSIGSHLVELHQRDTEDDCVAHAVLLKRSKLVEKPTAEMRAADVAQFAEQLGKITKHALEPEAALGKITWRGGNPDVFWATSADQTSFLALTTRGAARALLDHFTGTRPA